MAKKESPPTSEPEPVGAWTEVPDTAQQWHAAGGHVIAVLPSTGLRVRKRFVFAETQVQMDAKVASYAAALAARR